MSDEEMEKLETDMEAKAANPENWPMLLDVNGNLCEAMGSNIFLVRDGEVVMPPINGSNLSGLTRQSIIELCRTATHGRSVSRIRQQ